MPLVHTDEAQSRRFLRRALESQTAKRLDVARENFDLRKQIAKLERARKYLTERVAAQARQIAEYRRRDSRFQGAPHAAP